ncbi:MAG: DUF91 domain-containing protein [Trueperaceae bacterium]|nr:DUF91 domain-containing protein [Trueperaceae bacterium]
MADLKVFKRSVSGFERLSASGVRLEKELQTLIEEHMDVFLGVRFLASEYKTGERHRGRIDSLGLDENYSPVIVEYKRSSNDNVINQGLFYLDWLLDHKADFELLVQRKLGVAEAEQVDWSAPRVLCIAEDFSRYDSYAVEQMNRNIELIRYKLFGAELVLLELINAGSSSERVSVSRTKKQTDAPEPKELDASSLDERFQTSAPELRLLFDELQAFVFSLGEDVQEKLLKYYIAYRRLRNFLTVVIQPAFSGLKLYINLKPSSVDASYFKDGFARDSTGKGWGSGDLEVKVQSPEDLERVKALIQRSFDES